MKRLIIILAVLALVLVLPACNTTKGFGEDIENAGTGLKNSADRHGAD